MDPNDILALLAGGGSVVLIVAAGAWGVARGRRGKSSEQDAPEEKTGGAGSVPTAVADRPAAPTWADTLSAPAPAPPTSAGGTPAEASSLEEAPAQDPSQEPGEDADAGTAETPEATAETLEAGEGSAPFQATPSTLETPPSAPSAAEGPGTGTSSGQSAPSAADAEDETPQSTAPAAQGAEPAAEQAEPADEAQQEESADRAALVETPEAPQDRMLRLRERLARSGSIGRGILGLLTSSTVDEGTWDEIEETLLLADLGPDATDELLANLRQRMKVLNTDDPAAVRAVLREELIALVDPALDRRVAASARTAPDGKRVPSVVMMVGVNGTGKTTTVGKLARVLVAAERTVLLGAADTFRAAAAEQLATWGSRVGVTTVRSERDGADPAAVAFDAVKEGIEEDVDVVIIDTAGRLQNKKGLMDELGKVRRVAQKGLHGDEIAEVLLVIDATTGQNGMQQARVFSEAVNITGIVLTKLDGTAKGGIVVNVQRELGVPVKMVGLGEGMDDLTPFDPHGFVDALLGD